MSWTLAPAADFALLRDAWNRLNRAGPNSPLLEADFVEAALAEYGQVGMPSLRLACLGDAASPHAMALVFRPRFGYWTGFVPSQMPLCPWVSTTGVDLAEAVGSLARALPGPVLCLALPQLDPQFQPRPAGGGRVQVLDHIPTARLAVTGDFEAYWAARSRNLRHNLGRQRNRLAREGVETRLEVLTAADDVAVAVADYGRLESAGWKRGEGTAVHPDNDQGRFYTRLLEAFCHRGQGRIYRYFFGERLVATDLCIAHGGTLVVLKTTYDETVRTASPAMLMRQEYLAQLFADPEVHAVEFYGRVMEWHTRLSDDIRTLYHLNLYRWPGLLAWKRRLKPAAAVSPRSVAEEAIDAD